MYEENKHLDYSVNSHNLDQTEDKIKCAHNRDSSLNGYADNPIFFEGKSSRNVLKNMKVPKQAKRYKEDESIESLVTDDADNFGKPIRKKKFSKTYLEDHKIEETLEDKNHL